MLVIKYFYAETETLRTPDSIVCYQYVTFNYIKECLSILGFQLNDIVPRTDLGVGGGERLPPSSF